MAARRSAHRRLTRAFSLVELVVVLTILAVFAGGALLNLGPSAARWADPSSEMSVEREVRATAAWIQRTIARAILDRRDFALRVERNSSRIDEITLIWQDQDGDPIRRRSRAALYAIQQQDGSSAPQGTYRYSWRFQTMTPALTLRAFARDDDGSTRLTKWGISISGYGYVRVFEAKE